MNIVCLGDSITNGTGSTPGNSYPELLASRLRTCSDDISISNEGRPGNSTREYWEFMTDPACPLGKKKYHAVIIMLGTNDCRKDNWVETKDSLIYLEKIVERAKGLLVQSGRIFICTILPLADPMPLDIRGGQHGWEQKRVENEINPGIKELSVRLQVQLIDVYAAFKKELDSGKAVYDGIHPYDSGYKVIADTIGHSVAAAVHKHE
jgi:lysophospholipase L1-like esterase